MRAMWYTEATGLNQDFCKESSETSGTKLFTANKEWLWTLRFSLNQKKKTNPKMNGKAMSANKEAAAILYLAGVVGSLCTLMSS